MVVNKHRYQMSGLPAVEEEKWGRGVARERFGVPRFENGAPPPADHSAVQSAGDDTGAAGNRPSGAFNDVGISKWSRGGSRKPEFDARDHKTGLPKKW